MTSLIHADIFFFITSIAVVIGTLLGVIIGVYLIKTMRNFYKISETLRESVHDVDAEIRELAEQVRESTIFKFIFGTKKKAPRSKK